MTGLSTTFPFEAVAALAAFARMHDWRPLSAWKAAVERLQAHRSVRIAEARLRCLDDRMLKDIGLHRSEIESVLTDRACERRNGVHLPLRSNA